METFVAGERATLEGMLDAQREEVARLLSDLDDTEARVHLVPSRTTPLGLVKHATFVEKVWFHSRVARVPRSELGLPDTVDESFALEPDDTVESVRENFLAACERSREIAAAHSLDDQFPWHQDAVSLRFIYGHMIAELARHAGHGDIPVEQLKADHAEPNDASDGTASQGWARGEGSRALDTVRTVVVFDAADLHAESAFWAGVLGGQAFEHEEFHSVIDSAGRWRVGVQLAPHHVPPDWPDGAPQQVRLDLHIEDPLAAHALVSRFGARLLQAAPDLTAAEGHQVYADPAGHPFFLGWGHPSAEALSAFVSQHLER